MDAVLSDKNVLLQSCRAPKLERGGNYCLDNSVYILGSVVTAHRKPDA